MSAASESPGPPTREMTADEAAEVVRLGEALPWRDARAVDAAIDAILSERA